MFVKGVLVLTLVMMYVSSYPIVLTLRYTTIDRHHHHRLFTSFYIRSSREEAWEVSDEEEEETERKASIASPAFAGRRNSLRDTPSSYYSTAQPPIAPGNVPTPTAATNRKLISAGEKTLRYVKRDIPPLSLFIFFFLTKKS